MDLTRVQSALESGDIKDIITEGRGLIVDIKNLLSPAATPTTTPIVTPAATPIADKTATPINWTIVGIAGGGVVVLLLLLRRL
jgi:hypothetical protein